MPQNSLPEPGEFTRIFKRQHAAAQNASEADKKASEITARFPAAPAESAVDAHNTPQPPALVPPPVQGTPTAATNSSEPGEFTRYFMGGLPVKTSGAGTAAHRTPVGVQRPNSPIAPPKSLVNDKSVSFSERFSPKSETPVQPQEEFGAHNPRLGAAPDLSRGSMRDDTDPFGFHQPLPTPSKREMPGEFTSLFGGGEMPPAPRHFAVAPPPAQPMMSDSPNVPWAAPPTAKGPSEFTVIANGRQPAPAVGGGAGASDAQSSARKLPINVNMSPINPLGSLAGGGGVHLPGASASASMAGAHLNTPIGGVNVQAPTMPPLRVDPTAVAAAAGKTGGDYTKLILFFGVLAVLAVILVVAVVATQKN